MIRLLRLQNFKCFEEQSLDFRALTLLTGLNGTGKSSVFQSLLLLRQSYQQGLLRDYALALNGDLAHIGTGRDALFEGAKKEEIGFDLVLQDDAGYESQAKWRYKYTEESDLLDENSSSIDPGVYNASLFNDDFQYLQAERIGPRLFYETSDFLVQRYRQLGSRGESTAPFLSIFGDGNIPNKSLNHEDAKSLGLKDQVEAWLGEVCPDEPLPARHRQR